ncbi:hypothetical protein E2C01_062342 [Portunus trituberculatus]|uniref:Uncharacterized protein n=1 Tax=Portunus trituberculatus TaxID=210409 RepID=A0A5B7HEV3_PORTR|nr:hypothetical protein [Portunus trituberculatus]
MFKDAEVRRFNISGHDARVYRAKCVVVGKEWPAAIRRQQDPDVTATTTAAPGDNYSCQGCARTSQIMLAHFTQTPFPACTITTSRLSTHLHSLQPHDTLHIRGNVV